MTVRNFISKQGHRPDLVHLSFDVRETPQDVWVTKHETVLLNERTVYQALSDANAAWSTAKHEADVKAMYEYIVRDCAIYGCD